MNSLPRLVGESLESTDATNLSSKQVLTLMNGDSKREIKAMDLSDPTFNTVNCSGTVTCDSVECKSVQASESGISLAFANTAGHMYISANNKIDIASEGGIDLYASYDDINIQAAHAKEVNIKSATNITGNTSITGDLSISQSATINQNLTVVGKFLNELNIFLVSIEGVSISSNAPYLKYNSSDSQWHAYPTKNSTTPATLDISGLYPVTIVFDDYVSSPTSTTSFSNICIRKQTEPYILSRTGIYKIILGIDEMGIVLKPQNYKYLCLIAQIE